MRANFSVPAFVCGILGLVIPVVGFPFGILGIIFGVIAIREIKRNPELQGVGLSIAGFICGILGTILPVLILVFAIGIISNLFKYFDMGRMEHWCWLYHRESKSERVFYNYGFPEGNELTLTNFNGNIKVIGWEKDSIKVDIEKTAYGRTIEHAERNLRRIKVKINQTDKGINIHASETKNARCEFEIFINKSANVKLKALNGDIEAKDLRGRGKLTTVNGEITVENLQGEFEINSMNGGINLYEVDARVKANTKNGEINFRTTSIQHIREIRLETYNGSINLTLPESKDLCIYARASHGGIKSELPIVTSEDELIGERKIIVKTHNGEIVINKLEKIRP